MPDDIQIKLVHVEFLRAGPPHNQLLSPLTQYLAIAGDSGAGVVTVPYEHAEFERRLRELRYETGDPGDRQAMLHATGVEMGKILGSVPGLPGALAIDPRQTGTLVHLRLTLSASELALLPFELAKVPISPSVTAENWLSIQARPPACVTRNIRTVSPEGVVWPTRPRLLFISGDTDDVPYEEHHAALLNAIAPFQYPRRDDRKASPAGDREQYGDLLTILINPTLADVLEECHRNRYTHVHILTHGDLSETSRDSYGLALRGPDGATEVVSGEQFASALISVGNDLIHRPVVVTVASCDSGNVGTVVIPGASFAHALHQAGIPLVVASQFPLSKQGSVLLAGLYDGLLRGEHPMVLLQQLRAGLHARYTAAWHDWASLVVYEALPQALGDQLEAVRYFQAKQALDCVLERIDIAVRKTGQQVESVAAIEKDLEAALQRLPFDGPYHIECLGLRASSRKRLAQAAFTLASSNGPAGAERWKDPFDLLDQAWLDYDRAVRGLLVYEAGATQRAASLHWVAVQVESLSSVLGKDRDERRWQAAKLCADFYCDHQDTEQRAWAHGSLAELCLVRLADRALNAAQKKQWSTLALEHAWHVARLYPGGDEFPVKSTRRQFERYVDWWGTEPFARTLAGRKLGRREPWDGKFGLIETAKRMVAALQRKKPAPADNRSSGGSAPSGRPSTDAGSTPPAPAGPIATASSPPSADSGTPPAVLGTPAKPPTPTRAESLVRTGPFFDIEMLPAGHGDCLWIEYGDESATHRWLIDCGTQQTAKALLRRVEAVPSNQRGLELFVMSHIDSDHIGGALPFFKAVQRGLRFGDVWFNGWRQLSGQLGARQGEMFSTAIQDFELPWNERFEGKAVVVEGEALPVCTLPGGMKLTLLSPTPSQLKKLAPVWTREMKRYGLEPGSRVDYSRFLKGTPSTSTDVDQLADSPFAGDAAPPNGTSIVVLAEFRGSAALLGADAHAPVLAASIRKLVGPTGRLRLDAFKVSHHASQNNLSTELLQLLDCRQYLISTNGDHFCHPDREAIGRIIKYGGDRPSLLFNYRSKYNEVWERPDLQEKYGYLARYPEAGREGAVVPLLPGAPPAP
jgi:beta-lactamase superfamily II metal-dependent hydrolase